MHYPPLCFTFAFLATLSARQCSPAPLSTLIAPSGPPSASFVASSKAVVGRGVSGSPGPAESQAQLVAQTPTPNKGTISLGVLTVAPTAISPPPTQAPTTVVQTVAPITSQTQTTKAPIPVPTEGQTTQTTKAPIPAPTEGQTAAPTTIQTTVQTTGPTPRASSEAITVTIPLPPSTASTAQPTTTPSSTQSTSNAAKANSTTAPIVASTPGPLAAASTGASTAFAAITFKARTNNVTPQGPIIVTTLEMTINKELKTEAIKNKGTFATIGETKAGSNNTSSSDKEMASSTRSIEHTTLEYRVVKDSALLDQSPGLTPPTGGDVAQFGQGTTPLSSFMHSIVALVGVGVLVAVVVLGPLLVVLVVIVLLVVRCRARRQEHFEIHVHTDGHQERTANGRQGDSDGGERAQEQIALLDMPQQHEVHDADAHDTVPEKKTEADANAIIGLKKGNGAKKVNDSIDSPETPLMEHEGQVDEIQEKPEEETAKPRALVEMHDSEVKA